MNRTIISKKKPSYKVLMFWSIIGLLTLIFIGFVIFRFIDSRKVSIEDYNLIGADILEQEGTYYVYVYSRFGVANDKEAETSKKNELQELIEKYLKYTEKNSNASKIYGMVVDSGIYGNAERLIDGDSLTTTLEGKSQFRDLLIHVDDVPLLMKIQNGTVKRAFITQNDISKELQSAMQPTE
jgi:hypothetical protein